LVLDLSKSGRKSKIVADRSVSTVIGSSRDTISPGSDYLPAFRALCKSLLNKLPGRGKIVKRLCWTEDMHDAFNIASRLFAGSKRELEEKRIRVKRCLRYLFISYAVFVATGEFISYPQFLHHSKQNVSRDLEAQTDGAVGSTRPTNSNKLHICCKIVIEVDTVWPTIPCSGVQIVHVNPQHNFRRQSVAMGLSEPTLQATVRQVATSVVLTSFWPLEERVPYEIMEEGNVLVKTCGVTYLHQLRRGTVANVGRAYAWKMLPFDTGVSTNRSGYLRLTFHLKPAPDCQQAIAMVCRATGISSGVKEVELQVRIPTEDSDLEIDHTPKHPETLEGTIDSKIKNRPKKNTETIGIVKD
ncbi:hypothetical protein FA15DRAFT_662217, partial [Coprinopsis marcescibilis]